MYKNFRQISDIPDLGEIPVSLSSIIFSPTSTKSSAQKSIYKSPDNTPVSSPKYSLHKPKSGSLNTQIEPRPHQSANLSKLTQKIQSKEKQVQLLQEENKRLSKLKSSEKWEKELKNRNEDIRKLESQLNYFKLILREKVDSVKLLEVIEIQSKKIAELEIQVSSLSAFLCPKHDTEIAQLKSDNVALISALNEYSSGPSKEDWETLIDNYSILEEKYKNSQIENARLMEELTKIKKEIPNGSILYFANDICKINREVSKLLRIAQDVQQGRVVTLKGLLGIDSEALSAQQLYKEIQTTKSDLNKISNILSDILANHYAEVNCQTQ